MLSVLLFPSNHSAFSATASSIPASYYGEIHPSLSVSGFMPEAGMLVQASINNHLCGQSTTAEYNGQIVYSIEVIAHDQRGGLVECGRLGDAVTFFINQFPMAPNVTWDNRQIHNINLSPATEATPLPEPLPTPTPSPTSPPTNTSTPTSTLTFTATPLPASEQSTPTMAITSSPTISQPKPTQATSVSTPIFSATPVPTATQRITTSETARFPHIFLDPYTAGAAGSSFLLHGTGFQPNEPIDLLIRKLPISEDVLANADGEFSLAIVTSPDMALSPHIITVDGYQELVTAFVILPSYPLREPVVARYLIRYPLDIKPSGVTDGANRQNYRLLFPVMR